MGVVEVNTENSHGFCVPDNSSASELIASIARAGAIAQSSGGGGNHVVAVGDPLLVKRVAGTGSSGLRVQVDWRRGIICGSEEFTLVPVGK